MHWDKTGAACYLAAAIMVIVTAPQAAAMTVSSVAMETAKIETAQIETAAARALVPAEFDVPVLVKTQGFKIVPLGPDLVDVDFAAYMASIEHLQTTFTRSTSWPHENVSAADAMRDMETEQARFNKRESFAYAVLTPDGSRERGCIYVYPSEIEGYDAVVTLWVTKAEYDAGFDAELYAWAAKWVQADWPFKNIAYPGRAIAWASWDAMIAASKAKHTAAP